jgi:hypothetical protein
MNYKQIVLDQIRHKDTAYIPYSLPIEYEVMEKLDNFYGDRSWDKKIAPYIKGVSAVDTDPKIILDDRFAKDYYGGLWRMDRRPWHLEKPPLEQPAWGDYRLPKPEKFFRPDWKESAIRTCAKIRRVSSLVIWGGNFLREAGTCADSKTLSWIPSLNRSFFRDA